MEKEDWRALREGCWIDVDGYARVDLLRPSLMCEGARLAGVVRREL